MFDWKQTADAVGQTSTVVPIVLVNWLDDMQDANQCDRFEDDNIWIHCGKFQPSYAPCDEPEIFESFNRATVFDWESMFWEMYKVEGFSVKRMSDLYVNMCPRKWRANDGDCDDDDPTDLPDDLPYRRLILSAEATGMDDDTGLPGIDGLDAHIDGIEH